jgi:CDP-paratose 2-epimerase
MTTRDTMLNGNGKDDGKGRRVRVEPTVHPVRRAHTNGNGANGHADGHGGERSVLITGGAGFVGTNLAHRLLCDGERVTVLDDLSRPGVRRNLEWLQEEHGDGRLTVAICDIRDAVSVTREVRRASAVFHLAGQVAVTTSIDDPVHDFEVNAGGTLNVLEALRRLDDPPPLLFTSTNKVYGALPDVDLEHAGRRWMPTDPTLRRRGVSEQRPLDFHSPYGCSKGTADQYVRDYARTYGLPAVVFRMSCIYGPHQCGTEDQGWLAHFLLSTLAGAPLTLYGDGCQVRDVLFVDDLVEAMLTALDHAGALSGRAFNIGGGPANSVSLLEVIEQAGELHGGAPEVAHGDWRTGDQRYYVTDTSAFRQATGWRPRVSVADGVERLYGWLRAAGIAEEQAAHPSPPAPAPAAPAAAGAPGVAS